MGEKVNLAGIIHESLNNGPGIRRVLFAQGCKHNCKECFNPHTHGFGCGTDYKLDTIVEDINRNPLISGVTFSGGDPLEQANAFAKIAKEIKKTNKNVWCYTGYTFEYIVKNFEKNPDWNELLNNIDVLVDGKFDQSKKDDDLKYRGSSNQRIINVKESLNKNKVVELKLD
ncbi:anaerobic ribonucleoside-triphosphate reductase activating protein [Clostridium senegalense]|uniref:anaerobic ribonucleoside-triphosphate reductase activating protein n=1 Tax=Clostridium senegalense TaxID=1465809 RepID=UPI0002880FC2|nr:anaerobic ribonucleoside-triphosphate reductase activating protein [Clostridium senegalense]